MPALADGRLQRVLEDWSPPFPGFFLYLPSRQHAPPILRAFLDTIRSGSAVTSSQLDLRVHPKKLRQYRVSELSGETGGVRCLSN